MKKLLKLAMIIIAMTCCSSVVIAENTTDTTSFHGIQVQDLKIERIDDSLYLNLNIDMSHLDIATTELAVLTPYIINTEDSTLFNAIGVYGRNRMIYYQRFPELNPIHRECEALEYKEKERPDSLAYQNALVFEEWMEEFDLKIHYAIYGCCGEALYEDYLTLASFPLEPYKPEFIYIRPTAEVVKSRALNGSAFVDFPVSKTEIYPDYRNNKIELAKITGSIDSVKADPDITIISLSIKGFASPESPYSNNTRLAKGRTNSLKKYVENLYHFGEGFIKTSYEPENWEGLEAFVEASEISHKTEILEAIRSDREPDAKERYIKNNWNAEYKYLLNNCYPALRRTDYTIGYVIREYSTPEEIEKIMKSAPQKLSLEEFYVLTQTYAPDSEEHLNLWEVAVKMYPEDSIANLNAANVAMIKKDYERAIQHLEKAGQEPVVKYLRGVVEVLREDYKAARPYLEEAAANGVEEAQETLDNMIRHWTVIVDNDEILKTYKENQK